MRYLLVLPKYPIPAKSRYHKNYFPIGLLKIGTYLQKTGGIVKLVIGMEELSSKKFVPDKIYISSFFTYWARYVKETVNYYRDLFPQAKIIIGGIYASLMSEHCKTYTGCDKVVVGVLKSAENCKPDYQLFYQATKTTVDFCILWTTRGCVKKCSFCGAWKIEPKFYAKKTIKKEVPPGKRIVIFYDNNILANPNIDNILDELGNLKKERKILYCEAQCGFDMDFLLKRPELAHKLKRASFKNLKIAWDGSSTDYIRIKQVIDTLVDAGYHVNDIGIFMLFNHTLPFEELEIKRKICWEWRVQIINCCYRPLDNPFEKIIPCKEGKWTNEQIRQFRKNIRRQNICVRFRYPFYVDDFERKRAKMSQVRKIKKTEIVEEKIEKLEAMGYSCWLPTESWK